MFDEVSRAWVNARKRSIETHVLKVKAIESLNSACKAVVQGMSSETVSAEPRLCMWRLRNIINNTILSFDDEALQLDSHLERLEALVDASDFDPIKLAVTQLQSWPYNPKMALLQELLEGGALEEPTLLWPRSRAFHPLGWPDEAVDRVLQKRFPERRISWVRHLGNDLEEAVGGLVVWNPPVWFMGDEEHALHRPFRLGLARITHVFSYVTQGPTEIRFPMEEPVFAEIRRALDAPAAPPIAQNLWSWDQANCRLESIEEMISADTNEPTEDWWTHEDLPGNAGDLVEALCILTDDMQLVHLQRGEVVRGNGKLMDCEDLAEGDLVAVALRSAELPRSTALEKAHELSATWKSALSHLLDSVGHELVREGLVSKGISAQTTQTLRNWAGPDTLAPQKVKTFMALLDVLHDLVGTEYELPGREERDELWRTIRTARSRQSVKGREIHQENMRILQKVLRRNPVHEPGVVDVEGCIWQMRVCRVSEVRLTEFPYNALNRFERLSNGDTCS